MLDYVDLEADLDDEERGLRDSARTFVDELVRPDVGDHFEAGTTPTELFPEMGDRGFYAPSLEGYGLANASERAYGLVMQELEAGDSAIRSMASVQGALVIHPIHQFGSDAQRDRWLPALAAGETVGCFCLTEPEHGSNPAGMETTARRDGDAYVLSGTKRWITNAPDADLAVVWGRDTSAPESPVRGFLVETDRDGVEVEAIHGKLSMRVASTGVVDLDDVRVPADAVLPGVEGMRGPLACLTQARYGIAWGVVGAARDCFAAAREYALDREQFGGPIARFQLQQEKLADAATGVTTAQLLAYRLAALKSRGDLRPEQVAMAKRNNVETAQEVARDTRDMLGGNGITTEHPPMRHMANLETVSTYEGTHDIQTLILGADLTGIRAFE